MKARKRRPKPRKPSPVSLRTWGLIGLGLIGLLGALLLGRPAPSPTVATVTGTVEAPEGRPALVAPWNGRSVVAYEFRVDQHKLDQSPGKRAAIGARVARIASDRQSVPFRLRTPDGAIAVAGPVRTIDAKGEMAPEGCLLDALDPKLPAWAIALSGAQPPRPLEGPGAFVEAGACVPVGEQVTVVGQLSPDKQRLGPADGGLMIYIGSKPPVQGPSGDEPLLSWLYPRLLAMAMALLLIVAWLRFRAQA